MRAFLVLVAALSLVGCALDLWGTEWRKQGALVQEVSLAEVECARKAFEIGPGPDLVLGGLLDVVRLAIQESAQAAAFDSCMTNAGYQRAG